MAQPVELFSLPHREARALLGRGAPVYLFVNPVEYHGPHLSLHNDHLVSVGLATDLHARLAAREDWPFLVASSIEAGVEPCPGPGTRASSYGVVRQLVIEACRSLADLGARRVILMTFHGAPLHAAALDAGVELLSRRGVRALQPLNLLMSEMLEVDAHQYADVFAHVPGEEDRAAVMRELPTDFHAGFGETSITLHYAPGSVSPVYRDLPPCPAIAPDPILQAASRVALRASRDRLAVELRFAAKGRGWARLRPFPGYTGRPHLASAGAGSALAARIVASYLEATTAVFAGAPGPRPIMGWLVGLTLGGRIPGIAVPLEDVAGAA